MPKILDRLVNQLLRKGLPKSQAFAIANKTLQKNGVLKKGTRKLSKKGQTRNKMSPAQRAKSRAAKQRGGSPNRFKFIPKSNSVRVKKKK